MSNNIKVNGVDYFGISKVQLNDVNGDPVIFNYGSGSADLTPFLEGEIETFTVPADVDNLREGVFYGCKMLKAIDVEAGNIAYKAVDGVLFNADGTMLFAYPAAKEGTEYAIPSTVTSIADQAFGGSDVAVVLDAGLLNAGGAYPLVTDSIKAVVIPADAKFLDLDAFNNLTGVETVYYNAAECAVEVDGTESKGGMFYRGNPFLNCKNLKEVIVGGETTEIPVAMCYGASIKKIEILPSVTRIGNYAFASCSNLTDVIIPRNVLSVGGFAFQSSVFSSLIIEDGIITLEQGAFNGARGFDNVIIPRSVTEIGESCFYDCYGLSSVTILNPEVIIGSYAFQYCSSSLVIRGYTGSTAHTYAKDNGITFEAIDIPFTITVDNRHMVGYTGAENEELTVPMTFSADDGNVYLVTAIDANAFTDCANLTSVTLPSSITSIGADAFSGCTNLEVINFNETTTKFDMVSKEAGWRDSSSVIIMCTDGEWIETAPFVVTAENRHMVGYTGDENEELVIPSAIIGDDGTGYKVTGIGSDAFQNCTNLTSVTLPETVMSIDDAAFSGSDSTEVILRLNPAILDAGDAYPVSSSRINTVVIPEDTTYVDYDLLMNLPNVTGVHCYANCEFETVGVSDGKSTYYYNFINTSGSQIKKLVVGGQISTINSGMFDGNNIEELVIGESVTNINDEAFYRCYNLPSITYEGTIEQWNSIIFGWNWNNYSINKIICSNGSVYLNAYDFTVYADNRNMIGYTGEDNETLIIPAYFDDEYGTAYKVCEIGWNAFSDCTNLVGVTIPNTVHTIGSDAFMRCTGLTNVKIESTNCIISANSFDGCTALTNIVFSGTIEQWNSLTKYDNWNFGVPATEVICTDGAVQLTRPAMDFTVYADNRSMVGYTGEESENLIIPDYFTSEDGTCYKVMEFGWEAFKDCSNLTSVTIPDTVYCINQYSFYGCNGLTSITIPSSVTVIGSNAFENCENLSSITFNGTVSEWENVTLDAYWCNGTKVKMIQCADGEVTAYHYFEVTSYNRHMIGYTGEENENLVIPETLVDDNDITYKISSIGFGAFENCTNLSSVTIPNGTNLGNGGYSFSGCTNLININIPENCGYIPSNILSNCNNITSIIIPSSVYTIASNAFNGCVNLSNITFNGTVNEWNNMTFENNWNLGISATEIICSDGTVECPREIAIGKDHYSLIGYTDEANESLVLPETVEYNGVTHIVKRIDQVAFAGCENLVSIVIPNSIIAIGSCAFNCCSNLLTINYTGTVSEWSAISFVDDWNYGVPATEVICTDGTVSLVA